MIKIGLIFFSFMISATVNLNPKLEFIDEKVIDVNLNDPELLFPLQNFLIELPADQDVRLDVEVLSKKVIENKRPLSSDDLNSTLMGYNRYDIFTSNNEKITYFVSDPMYMRGVRIAQVAVLPYSYLDGNIVLYESMSINVDIELNDEPYNVPISRDFEVILSSLVANFETRSRNQDKKPCILYVCGGDSSTHPSMQDLIEWRRQMGYEVHIAEVSQIGSTTNQIKDYIQDAYQNWSNPPEYIVLVGDTGGSYAIPYFSSTWGASDYDYTLLEGGDLLPEMIAGRISAEGSSDLSNIINKTLIYEKATYIDFTGTDWYERAALNADPSSSGNSTIITNEYVEEILDQNGFEDINTNYGNGNYANWMQNELSDGLLYFNYRGYIGTSGFGAGNISNANNGYMNPFATFITCSTGDFNYTCLSEDFIRAGSATNPKGAVAAVGTATSSTHTAPNNIIQMGIYDGIFSKNLKTAGASLVSAKITLFNTYIVSGSSIVEDFTRWNNLMGDPVLHLWTDTPKNFNVIHNSQINWGSNYYEVIVQDDNGQYVEDAWVTLIKDDWSGQPLSILTDQDGSAIFSLDYIDISDITLTITKRNFIPYQSNIQIADESNYIILNNMIVQDLGGSADGAINSGESFNLLLDIESSSSLIGESFEASINALTDNIEVNENLLEFSMEDDNQLLFSLDASNLIDDELIQLHLNILGDNVDWEYIIEFNAESANIEINQSNWFQIPEPGIDTNLHISLENIGDRSIADYQITLISENEHILNSPSVYTSLGAWEVGEVVSELLFPISFSNNIINGSQINFSIEISSDQYSQSIPFNVTVGQVTVNDPLGPDQYGYYIYDSQDWGYGLMPDYDWVEIDPSEGGDGYDLQISDSGNGNNISGNTKYVDLPFNFKFYGVDYNQISVNSNGWICLGYTGMESFRNYPLPGAGGPSPMIAAFWDDLITNNNSGVYAFIEEDHVIIQWSKMRTYDQNSEETFQIILYDSVTPTGDGEIKIQYKEFNNTSSFNYLHPVYSTIGIENHLGNIGLEYSYNNQYPVAAMPLFDQSAIFITTRNTNVYNLGDVNQDDASDILDIILIVNHILNVDNLSSLGEYLADLNQNSVINILDVIMLINVILDS